MIDLSQLPKPDVIESIDFEAILAALKADLVALHPPIAAVIELESEPVVKLLEVVAYREIGLRARYNDEARAMLLAYSSGTDLDHIGITYYDGEQRLLVTPADLNAVPPIEAVWESDDNYRQRLALKPESYSVAGPRDAFLFHAMSASGQVKSAAVTSPIGGTTEVFILSRTGNGVPDQALIDTVSAALNAETVRPLSEEVIVTAGSAVNYTLEVALTLFPGPSVELVLATVNTRLADFAAKHHLLDADVMLSAIHAAAHVDGVKKVDVVSPVADIVCTAGQAPYCTGITITIAGVEP